MLSLQYSPLEALRRRIENRIWSVTRTSTGYPIDLSTPRGDPGLFGPASVSWKVHDDFPAMMVGGIRALILQALHPLALAGVLEHSIFRQDMRGRLARTAQFVAGTTYGSTRDAMGLIGHVNRIHQGISGVSADGRPYAATNPELLKWVHVAEVSSFLGAYLRYVNPRLTPADQDRYLAETATVARQLGAADVPESLDALRAYMHAQRGVLIASARMHDAISQLAMQADASPSERLTMRIVLGAAIRLLPSWASSILGPPLTRLVRGFPEPAMHAGCVLLRWAIRNSAAARAQARVAPCAEAVSL
ncbi:oxygenase MpaB family protein (plasmid) [Cupriavidus pinatubonensis]|uniref:oxygenase MpaB family protein n=1 Tax=Cupriavidus pinatubonensis TaxID=248026 RepID=UPI001C72AF9C|nr:oxygenase MpaB family protein [Cupriavidus pinatubonensis]QYY34016.1 oxygenase MpaB family protein [Cupriavidus pinatubonensis]